MAKRKANSVGMTIELAEDLKVFFETDLDLREQIDQMALPRSQDDFDFAGEMLQEIDANIKFIEDEQSKITDPISQGLEATRKLFRPPLKYWRGCKAAIKDRIAQGHLQQQQQVQASLNAAGEALRSGDQETAAVALSFVEPIGPIHGVTLIHGWDYEVENLDEVPREYLLLILNDDAIRSGIKDGARNIPGLRIFPTTNVRRKA
jgi:hypothetical protein